MSIKACEPDLKTHRLNHDVSPLTSLQGDAAYQAQKQDAEAEFCVETC